MKKIKGIILPLFLFIGSMTGFNSCRDDLSTMDVNKIPGVSIDTAGIGSFSMYQYEHLIVNPKLSTGSLKESDLKFEWSLNRLSAPASSEVIGTEKNLDYEVRLKPNASGSFYQITLTVTDSNTGLQYLTGWRLVVKNNIGEGLVVAENSDGQQTDLSHIMSPEVTTGYTGVSVKHHLYSSINNSYFSGIVKQMQFVNVFGENVLFGISDDAFYAVNTLDYSFRGKNEDLFYGHSTEFKPRALGTVYLGTMLAENGKLYGTNMGAARKFGLPFDFPFNVPSKIAFNSFSDAPVGTHFYDEVNGYFVYQSTIQTWGDRNLRRHPSVSGKTFDPGNLPGKINMAAGVGLDYDILHLLKDKASGKLSLYVLDRGGYDEFLSVIPPSPKAVYDLSAAPEISNAKFFVFLPDQRVLYYATESKIYAMIYSTSSPVFQEKYSAPAGETITTLQLFQDAIPVYFPDDTVIPTHNKQLVLSTYGTEGKVYLLPLINPGTGNIDLSKIKSFGGFGHITAIAPQK